MSECPTCDTLPDGIHLCAKCSTTMAYAVANIAAYWADLDTIQTKAARYGDGVSTRGSVGKTLPLPIDPRFGDITAVGTQLRYDTWATIVAWCRVLMDEQPEVDGPTCDGPCLHRSCNAVRLRRWPTARAMRASGMRAMCLYLDRQHRWIEGRDWAPAMLDEITDLEGRLRRMVDRPAGRWYAGKCDCGEELYATEGKAIVECRECGGGYDVQTRRDFLLREARDVLVTATEAASALALWTDWDGNVTRLRGLISKWHERDRLTPRGAVDHLGHERVLYRLGDVETLLIGQIQRDAERAC